MLLENMDARLFRKTLFCGAILTVAISSGILGLGYFLHLQFGFFTSAAVCAGVAIFLYCLSWLEHDYFWPLSVIVMLTIVVIIFQELPVDNSDISFFRKKSQIIRANKKNQIELAIAKRKSKLEKLLNSNSLT
jgi:hypothetical protein